MLVCAKFFAATIGFLLFFSLFVSLPAQGQTNDALLPLVVSKIAAIDLSGNEATNFTAGHPITVIATITNTEDRYEHFSLTLEIRNEVGITELLHLRTATINPLDSTQLGSLWIPAGEGRYDLRAFLISNSGTPRPLSDVAVASIVVEGGQVSDIPSVEFLASNDSDLVLDGAPVRRNLDKVRTSASSNTSLTVDLPFSEVIESADLSGICPPLSRNVFQDRFFATEELRQRAIATEEINAKYERIRERLGEPISGDVTRDPIPMNAYYKEYENGTIYWTPQTCAHVMDMNIYTDWKRLNQQSGIGVYPYAGFPITDTLLLSDRVGKYNYFGLDANSLPGGILVSKGDGAAKGIVPPIFYKWERLGAERSVLKYPTSDYQYLTDYGVFEGGRIYYGRNYEGFALYSPIVDKYVAMNGLSVLGRPSTDTFTTGDGGLYAYFEGHNPTIPDGAAIFWSSRTGAQWLSDDILLKWESLGSERSCLGYPVTDPYDPPSRVSIYSIQDFERGKMFAYRTGLIISTCGDPCPDNGIRNFDTGECRAPHPPKIEAFYGTPRGAQNDAYIERGESVTLHWEVTGCDDSPCTVKISGATDRGTVVLYQEGLNISGTLVHTPTDLTRYTLKATNAYGQDSKQMKVSFPAVGPCSSGCEWYYFKATNPNSFVSPCVVIAEYAPDQETAKVLAQAEFGSDYTITSITYEQWASGSACA
jgi:hypothetical protein